MVEVSIKSNVDIADVPSAVYNPTGKMPVLLSVSLQRPELLQGCFRSSKITLISTAAGDI